MVKKEEKFNSRNYRFIGDNRNYFAIHERLLELFYNTRNITYDMTYQQVVRITILYLS